MSKSLGNYIALEDTPKDMFGKIMSISDTLMWRYYELLSFENLSAIEQKKSQVANGRNPKELKVELAMEIVARFHSQALAKKANEDFHMQFSQNKIPTDIPTFEFAEGIKVINLLKDAKLTASTSESIRMIKQGAVKIDGQKILDKDALVASGSAIYQVGKKKFAKIVIS